MDTSVAKEPSLLAMLVGAWNHVAGVSQGNAANPLWA